ncbi:hypothetical protein GCM10010282_59770 [Streptomyces roseolus]|nr:hypothetical protein GCM10010282_59770 [Streptomyces roseolus]
MPAKTSFMGGDCLSVRGRCERRISLGAVSDAGRRGRPGPGGEAPAGRTGGPRGPPAEGGGRAVPGGGKAPSAAPGLARGGEERGGARREGACAAVSALRICVYAPAA